MAFKFVAFATLLAYANAGLIGAPAAVATYSAAPAVSSSYFHQATAPVTVAKAVAPVAYSAPVVSSYAAHAAPVVSSYAAHAAPLVSSYSAPLVTKTLAAPVVSSYAAHAPVVSSYSAPVVSSYSAPVFSSYAAPAIGASHQSVERSLGGAQSVSHYTKAVDSAFSSVRKFDTRITNDGLRVAAAPLAVAHAAPVVSTYGASPLAYSAHAAPVVSAYSAAPVVAKTAAVAYSPAAVVSHATFNGLGASYGW